MLWLAVFALIAASAPVSRGHMGDRIIPIFELSEAELAHIDLQDGSIAD